MIGKARRDIETWLALFSDTDLQVAVGEEFVGIVAEVQGGIQARVYERHVETLQVIVAVQRPMGIDRVVDAGFFHQLQFLERHPGDALAQGGSGFGKTNCGL